MFGASDLVILLEEMIRAVVRARAFPEGVKIAKHIFCWKGVGLRNSIENCRTFTMANVILKLTESCVKCAAQTLRSNAGFPRSFWAHFFDALESVFVWLSTVKKYLRSGVDPQTALTNASRAFDRVYIIDFFKGSSLILAYQNRLLSWCLSLSLG